MFMLCFHVPETHLEVLKNAIFATGAGTLADYSHCSWQTLGEGQFMPEAAAKPFLGQPHQLEKVAEYKVEILCTAHNIAAAVQALKQTHPYEVPSYQVLRLETEF